MSTVQQTVIDGVPCFWVETGRPTLAASLVFRTGMVDEFLNESGWTHLLEHLALHGRRRGTLEVNGSVSELFTRYDVHGPVGSVVSHLADLTRWLREPVLHDVEREKGVLRAESKQRGGASTTALMFRYGAGGPGLAAYPDVGIGRATEIRLVERAERIFLARNAALVLDGPPPPSLRLHLMPGGVRIPIPAARPCEGLGPSGYTSRDGLVLSGTTSTSVAATFLPDLLQDALRDNLRDAAGAAYAPWSHYERVDASTAVVFAGSDCNVTAVPDVALTALRVLDELAQSPRAQQIANVRDRRLQQLADPYNALGLALRAATRWLCEEPAEDVEQIRAGLRDVSPAAVAEAARSVWETFLLGVPAGARWPGIVPDVTRPGQSAGAGREHRHVNWPAVPQRLVIGPESVHVAHGVALDGAQISKLAGMLQFTDGVRSFVNRDGRVFTVDPSEWIGAGYVLRELDEAVPAMLHLPQPWPSDLPEIRKLSTGRRLTGVVRRKKSPSSG